MSERERAREAEREERERGERVKVRESEERESDNNSFGHPSTQVSTSYILSLVFRRKKKNGEQHMKRGLVF